MERFMSIGYGQGKLWLTCDVWNCEFKAEYAHGIDGWGGCRQQARIDGWFIDFHPHKNPRANHTCPRCNREGRRVYARNNQWDDGDLND